MTYNGFLSHIDLAQVVLYIFWLFFARLIYYLVQENKREGYPLAADAADRSHGPLIGWPVLGSPRTYILPHGGGTFTSPNPKGDTRPIALAPSASFPGAPLEPTGNPLVDGVGPASYAERSDVADLLAEGGPRIVPLRAAPEFGIAGRDPDPRGMAVIGTDGVVAGEVTDAWVDRAEYIFRYFEVALPDGRHVLLPVTFCTVNGTRRTVGVKAITAAQFADVPAHANPEQVTFLEEDKICGYYGGGYLYATPDRAEPLI